MDVVLLLSRAVLAAVFAVAGASKLADLPASRRAVRDFGLPAALAAPLGIALPGAELVVAVALLIRPAAWWGAVAAAALLAAFAVAVAANLARGRRPACNCFGRVHSEPIGPGTLARNAALVVVALPVLLAGPANPGPSFVAWLGALPAGQAAVAAAALTALVLLLAAGGALLVLTARYGVLLSRLDAVEARLNDAGRRPGGVPENEADGLPVGSAAPSFAVAGVHGDATTLEALRAAGRPVALVFSDPDCGVCSTLLPEVGRWQRELADRLTVAVIGRGEAKAMRPVAAEHGLTHVYLQRGREVAERYAVAAVPAAVLIDAAGRIAAPPALGVTAVRALVAGAVPAAEPSAASRPAAPVVPLRPAAATPAASLRGKDGAPGTEVPSLALAAVDGRRVALASLRGRPRVLLFWNPDSPYCLELLDELKAWEAERPAGAPELVLLASGSAAANRAFGFRSPVLLDPEWRVGYAFGGVGTPSAVAIDADGRSVGEVARGGYAVLRLVGGADLADGFKSGRRRVGRPAPEIALPDLDGRTVRLSDLRGRPRLVLFWRPGCAHCARMLPALRAWEESPPADAPALLVISSESVEANRVQGLRAPVLLDEDAEVRRAYKAFATPAALLVDAEGLVASPIVEGAAAVFALANGADPAAALDPAAAGSALGLGDPVPAMMLPDLDGAPVNVSSLRGHDALLLFWNPGCGFCRRMLDDLKAWEAARADGDPRLLVVSTGDPEANRALGLRSPIVLDQEFGVGASFGATGTPSAVRLDADGRVASAVAVGAQAVFDLANAPAQPAGR